MSRDKSFAVGLDVGGTKIAGAVFTQDRQEVAQIVVPTPSNYPDFVTTCVDLIQKLESKTGQTASIGMGLPGPVDHKQGSVFTSNIPCLQAMPLAKDLHQHLGRKVAMANDADCAALSEAVDGAGASCATVFGLIMGTGVGGGYVAHGKILQGVNGLTGEIGHLPLPFREDADGPLASCACGQKGCIDKTVSGSGLMRFYESMTGGTTTAESIVASARRGDAEALRVLDQFYTVVAKAMVAIIHSFDPEIIVIGGGLNSLPGLYEQVPKRWGRYVVGGNPKTKIAPAKHGAMSGLRGAAWVGRSI